MSPGRLVHEPRRGEASEPQWGPVRIYRRRPGGAVIEVLVAAALRLAGPLGRVARGRRPARLAAPLALLAAGAAVAAVVLADQPNRAAPGRTAPRPAPAPAAARGALGAHAARAPRRLTKPTAPPRATTTASTTRAPAAARSATAAGLEARGHDLLLAGQAAAAVPVLRRAVLATGERPGACRQPSTQTCLTYAYALYDLGRALRLSGRAADAVPILERRLAIDDHRQIVAAELRLARRGRG